MNTKTAIIGKGKWGKKIIKNLKQLSNLKVIAGKNFKKKIFKNNFEYDWVFVSTPNKTHYKIIKFLMTKKNNIFCEKPLTLDLKTSNKINYISRKKKIKLYVSDIYFFHPKKIIFLKKNLIIRKKKVSNRNDKDFLYRFLYHDISILYNHIKKLKIMKINYKNIKRKFFLNIYFNKKYEIKFIYDLDHKEKIHKINDQNLITKKNILGKMIKSVIGHKVDFAENKKKSIFVLSVLKKVEKHLT